MGLLGSQQVSDRREMLRARAYNTWFYTHERDEMLRLADEGEDQQVADKLEWASRTIRTRLDQWRQFQ